MTEKEAWLKLAEMFDSSGPLPTNGFFLFIGLCHGTQYLREHKDIDRIMEGHMDRSMFDHFDYDPNPNRPFVWAGDSSRASRTLRATACGFLAAMCDEGNG